MPRLAYLQLVMHNTSMHYGYIGIDFYKIQRAIKDSSLRTIGQAASALGVHRNTISDYLRGETPVVAPTFEALLQLLSLKAEDVFYTHDNVLENLTPIAELIEDLTSSHPEVAFFLFGSRSRRDYKEFSDYDIGAYSKSGLSGSSFAKLHVRVLDWNETHMTSVQIVNLNNADRAFLSEIRADLKFLSGSFLSRNHISTMYS